MFTKIAIVSTIAATALATNLSAAPQENLKLLFEAFKKNHGRQYSNDEESTRFEIFVNNLKTIDERNEAERKAGGSAVHGINRFSDLTHAEFAGKYLGYQPQENSDAEIAKIDYQVDATYVKDWTGVLTTPVKDQGYCGSCWAFAASEQIESDTMKDFKQTFTLSPQQLVECDRSSLGCNGGLQERAYNYVKRAGGIQSEASYPYTSGVNGTAESCSADKDEFLVTVTGYTTISEKTTTATESAMASYVAGTKGGPVSIAIDATTWSTYTGGIMASATCGHEINHAVQLVGVDTGAGYWKIRNSWNTNWGENGFIRLQYGADTCGVSYDVTYTATKVL